jgi:hypothetical protein
VLAGRGNDAQKIGRLYMTSLGRQPTRPEMAAATKYLKSSRDPLTIYQDLFWALLNSNEFIFNH